MPRPYPGPPRAAGFLSQGPRQLCPADFEVTRPRDLILLCEMGGQPGLGRRWARLLEIRARARLSTMLV